MLTSLIGGPAKAISPATSTADIALWQAFKSKFLREDGRVVDTGNAGISHSEGQGVALLFAQHVGDAPAFELIRHWTSSVLRCRGDGLHAWRFLPNGSTPVPDRNNATDGDLMIAAALARGAVRWGHPELMQSARLTALDIHEQLILGEGARTLLLPGTEGFRTEQQTIVNPSYYLFALLDDMAAIAPSPCWDALRKDGLAMIEEGRFGAWSLPPDWLAVACGTGRLSPAPYRPARFSYDAVRVPLHLAWARLAPAGVLSSIDSFWRSAQGSVTAWVDLTSGATSPWPPSQGMRAVRQITAVAAGGHEHGPAEFSGALQEDYYSAALLLLTRLAWADRSASAATVAVTSLGKPS